MKKTKDITNKSPKELIKLINENREKLQSFRFGNAGSKVKNVKEGKNIRKDIARLMTVLTTISKAEAIEQKAKAKVKVTEKAA